MTNRTENSTGRRRRRGGNEPGKQRRSWLGVGTLLLILVVLAAYGGFLWYSRPDVAGEELRLGEFVQLASEDRISEAIILDYDGIVTGTYERDDGTEAAFQAEYFRQGELREWLANVLMSNGVPFEIDQQFLKTLWLPATLFTPAIVIVVVFIYLVMSYQRGTGLFGLTSGARRIDATDADVTFADVAGQDAAVAELRELADFLATPERFTALGAHVPKGVLVYGPPGCGKTLLARALAGEAGAAFYSISGSDFVELYVGVGASRVRDLFREARDNAPAIVFIDELDSIGAQRSSSTAQTGSSGEQEQALNQILAEMDGFAPTDGLMVIAATNRPDVLDPALLRPGRFDRSVGLERPDETERAAILEVHTRDKPLAADVDLTAIAHHAMGLTGADLANVANEAALLTARAGKTAIDQTELERALTRIMEAPERQRRLAMRDRELGHQALGTERIGFDDVAGVEEAMDEIVEVRDFLAEPERFEAVGARMPRGLLLSGPPGCGKTLLARAVAGEANAAFVSVAATEFTEIYVGEGAARVRDLFAQVQAMAPAILFIDELDAIGARRSGGTDAGRERENTLNQLLIELDGFGPRTGVVVMAATNRPDILDSALVRPGRFDRRIALELPDRAARRAILDVHAADKTLASDLDLDMLAARTRGLSGADLANVLNEAALLAARRDSGVITTELVEEAMDRAHMGVARRRMLSDAERHKTAYHETGHALVARVLDTGKLPHKVSIVARGHMLGSTTMIDGSDSEEVMRSRSQLIDDMAIALGGRAAEELVFGEPDGGSASDLDRATTIARTMVTRLGMSTKLGRPTYATNGGVGERGPETMTLIDTEIRALIDEAAERARAVLAANRDGLQALADALADRETLLAEDLDEIIGPPRQPPAANGAVAPTPPAQRSTDR